MKTQMNLMIWLLTLLALLSTPHLASAYYDPGVQRWINRDPLGDFANLGMNGPFRSKTISVIHAHARRLRGSTFESLAGPDLFEFVANNPMNSFDPDGTTIPVSRCQRIACGLAAGVACEWLWYLRGLNYYIMQSLWVQCTSSVYLACTSNDNPPFSNIQFTFTPNPPPPWEPHVPGGMRSKM
jgi:hypothetical protein